MERIWVIARAHLSRTSCLLSSEALLNLRWKHRIPVHEKVNGTNLMPWLSSRAHPSSRTAMRNSCKGAKFISGNKNHVDGKMLSHFKPISSPLCTLLYLVKIPWILYLYATVGLHKWLPATWPLATSGRFWETHSRCQCKNNLNTPIPVMQPAALRRFPGHGSTMIYLNTMGHWINDNRPFQG